jgi:hypothetical protein
MNFELYAPPPLGEGDREAVEGVLPEGSPRRQGPPQSLRDSSPKGGAAFHNAIQDCARP